VDRWESRQLPRGRKRPGGLVFNINGAFWCCLFLGIAIGTSTIGSYFFFWSGIFFELMALVDDLIRFIMCRRLGAVRL